MKPVRKIAVHELVVDRIRRAIHLGDYLPGDRLPSEREIADRLEVSRVTVREAVRVLESEGYVVSRRGATGGLTVTALAEPVARMMERLQADPDGIVHLMEFRRANECLAARLAAFRRGDEDLERMARPIEDLATIDDIPRFRRADAGFHLAVAVAARNPHVERAVLDAREAIFLFHGGREYEVLADTTLEGHRRVFEAISAGDGDAAESAMGEHIDIALGEILNAMRMSDDVARATGSG
jgi:DNA-binding FadR family transcriptional regulator